MSGEVKKQVRVFFSSDFFGLLLSAFVGGLFFFTIFGNIFWPTHIDWILIDGWDTFQKQIGWEFFRNTPWSWPLGLTYSLGYPIGVAITYCDSIPLMAVIFKLIDSFLPEVFQYLGFWAFLCFVLQGTAGFLLTRLIRKDVLINFLGSCLFILSPILIFRVAGHVSLASHFLILSALFLTLRNHKHLQIKEWLCLLSAAILIQPYFVFMIVPFWLADQICLWRQDKWRQILLGNIAISFFILLISYTVGLFYTGSAGAGGYGDFSMNLNALVNPWGWSRILPDLPLEKFQYEGFNYLGVGVLFAVLISSIGAFKKRKYFWVLVKKYRLIIFAALILSLVVVSNKIYFGHLQILNIPLPKRIENIFGVVRASGRLFWPVYYLIVLFSLSFVKYWRRSLVILLLILAIFLQIFDISSALREKRLAYNSKEWSSPLVSFFWSTLPSNYKHFSYIPTFDRYDLYAPLALFAAQHKMTMNTGYFTREIEDGGASLRKEIEDVKSGSFDPGTVYVFFGDPTKFLPKTATSSAGALKEVDGYKLFLPYKK